MGLIRVMVSIPSPLAGVGFDGFVNTWYFENDGVTPTDTMATVAFGWLETFYNAIDGRMPDDLVSTTAFLKAYDLADPEPRAPIAEDTMPLVPVTTTPLPPEVAVCLSYRAEYVSGVSKARRRGRVYLGPWTSTNIAADGRPSATMTDEIRDAAAALLASSDASTDATWTVFSPTAGTSSPVVGGWVDDEWDIQRRRSNEVTLRQEFAEGHI